jgi:outer membrane protein assembly factor BamB
MKITKRFLGVLSGSAVLIAACCANAQDWPQWRGLHRDGKVAGFTAPQTWPKTLNQGWKTTVGQGDATPALVGDKLYVFSRQGDDEVILCLNAADGKELWKTKYAAQAVTGPAARHPGPRSSPIVADGKVLTLGVGGVLSCLNAADGKELWRKDEFPKMVPAFFTAMSPIVVDGLCIAQLGGKGQGAIVAFDLADGTPKWKWTGDGPAYGSPVCMEVEGVKQVVAQTEKNIVGIAVADGKLLWQIAAAAQGRAFNSATPIVDGPTVIYTGQGRGTQAVKIEKEGDGFTVKELWSNDKLGTGYNTPVLKDGLLFGLSDRGNFFCLNARTGEAVWTDTGKHGNFGSVLDAGPAILALPDGGELIAFAPGDKQFEELAHWKVSETKTYAHPVIAGNRIFVKDQDTLTLWTLE